MHELRAESRHRRSHKSKSDKPSVRQKQRVRPVVNLGWRMLPLHRTVWKLLSQLLSLECVVPLTWARGMHASQMGGPSTTPCIRRHRKSCRLVRSSRDDSAPQRAASSFACSSNRCISIILYLLLIPVVTSNALSSQPIIVLLLKRKTSHICGGEATADCA